MTFGEALMICLTVGFLVAWAASSVIIVLHIV